MSNGNRGKATNFPGMRQKVGTINVNLQELESAICPVCNTVIFDTGFVTYKKLPAVQSPTGKAMLIAIPVVVCTDCGAMFHIMGDQLSPINPEGE